ncbi:MAG: hypothetical protein IJR47_04415 [Clostridia bacterium]|nr:hypothetical protein [Clostridia bacterium]
MARRLRKGRVAIAAGVLVLVIALICLPFIRGCKRTTNTSEGVNGNSQTTETTQEQINALQASGAYIKEYSGQGELVSSEASVDDKGRAVYDIKYKGTTIESCFSYAGDTLGIKGEWTEEITEELYTMHREYDGYILDLRCEPKAQNGYDLNIKVTVK